MTATREPGSAEPELNSGVLPGNVHADDWIMLILAAGSVGLLGFTLLNPPTYDVGIRIFYADCAICGIFLLEFLWRWRRRGWKRSFLARSWYEPLAMIPVAHPALAGPGSTTGPPTSRSGCSGCAPSGRRPPSSTATIPGRGSEPAPVVKVVPWGPARQERGPDPTGRVTSARAPTLPRGRLGAPVGCRAARSGDVLLGRWAAVAVRGRRRNGAL